MAEEECPPSQYQLKPWKCWHCNYAAKEEKTAKNHANKYVCFRVAIGGRKPRGPNKKHRKVKIVYPTVPPPPELADVVVDLPGQEQQEVEEPEPELSEPQQPFFDNENDAPAEPLNVGEGDGRRRVDDLEEVMDSTPSVQVTDSIMQDEPAQPPPKKGTHIDSSGEHDYAEGGLQHYDIRLPENFRLYIVGPSRSGKTRLLGMLLENLKQISTKLPERVVFVYNEEQEIYKSFKPMVDHFIRLDADLQANVEKAIKGASSSLVIFDDCMGAPKAVTEWISRLFTTQARHRQMSMVYVRQKFYSKLEAVREIDRNSDVVILTRNNRDGFEVSKSLARQMGVKSDLFGKIMKDALNTYGYIYLNLSSLTDAKVMFLTGVFEEKGKVVGVYDTTREIMGGSEYAKMFLVSEDQFDALMSRAEKNDAPGVGATTSPPSNDAQTYPPKPPLPPTTSDDAFEAEASIGKRGRVDDDEPSPSKKVKRAVSTPTQLPSSQKKSLIQQYKAINGGKKKKRAYSEPITPAQQEKIIERYKELVKERKKKRKLLLKHKKAKTTTPPLLTPSGGRVEKRQMKAQEPIVRRSSKRNASLMAAGDMVQSYTGQSRKSGVKQCQICPIRFKTQEQVDEHILRHYKK